MFIDRNKKNVLNDIRDKLKQHIVYLFLYFP